MSVKTSEILVGRKAAKKLQSSIKSILAVETVKQTGELMKSTVRAVKERQTEELQRLVISQPHYGFKLNHGFTGVKKNKVPMTLKPINHLNQAIERTNVLEVLATDIANIRADEVVAKINF